MNSHTHTPPTLPQELVDHIIDHLHDHRRGLSNISLVSYAWLGRARYHLFHKFSVTVWRDGGDIISFMAYLTDSPVGGFGPHIQHLVLDDTPLTKRSTKDRFVINGQIVSSILEKLTNLKTLELKSMVYSPLLPATATDILPSPHTEPFHLQRLVIHVIGTQDPDLAVGSLLDALSVFGEIDELEILPHLEDIYSLAPLLPQMLQPIPVMPVVHRLQICFPYLSNGMFQGVVVRALSSTGVTALSVRGCATRDHFMAIGQLLANASSTLEYFELEFFSWQMLQTLQESPRDWQTLNLRLCASLHTLTINRFTKSPSSGLSIDPSVLMLLSVAPSSLRALIIGAFSPTAATTSPHTKTSDGSMLDAMQQWDWRGLRQNLRRFEALDSVTFVTWKEPMNGEVRHVVQEGLPELYQAGSLRFEVPTRMDWG